MVGGVVGPAVVVVVVCGVVGGVSGGGARVTGSCTTIMGSVAHSATSLCVCPGIG